ncbi:MAG TPA: DUF4301 family protein [Thermodesulfobacteriota bacterium]|nr:DUF4301 family protein [Thermodesulfobacteriota bacterium]
MKEPSFSPEDRVQMQSLGISEEQVKAQIQVFRKSSSFARLRRPCTLGDGIQRVSADELEHYLKLHEEAALEGRFTKFVPASGAASRMFKLLFEIYDQSPLPSVKEFREQADRGDQKAKDFVCFQDGFRKLTLFDDLKSAADGEGLPVEKLLEQDRWQEILKCLLSEEGLNCGSLPKGLLRFHRYPSGNRTALEEHFVEAIHTVRDRKGICRIHLTVSPEHEEPFRQCFEKIRSDYEQSFQCLLEVTFSIQEHSTDTIAVDLDNQPFRERDGRLLFRPGGHGALLSNLLEIRGDLIYLKNIDNILPDRLRGPTILWKKVLGGLLVEIQRNVHGYVRQLTEGSRDVELFETAMDFARRRLLIPEPEAFKEWTVEKKRDYLLKRLNRPVRVCGMVRNEGEPGGGPFWVEGKGGNLSLQIVESVEVDPQSPEQQAVWGSSTHFNPVDLVCAVKDFRGNLFPLKDYVNPGAVFITRKSKDGRDLKSLELPGLWNGAMAEWISLFVEVPIATFNPVKTINDLLKSEHQSG